ncbi:MAG: hypothetical protein FJ100_08810 [Deltaproteobacteria bacterium]|nr:hypothetical protein [Deltaproteobacteria bacterium]
MSKASAAQTAQRAVRLAAWGQIAYVEPPLGEAPLLVETVHTSDDQAEWALAVADGRMRLRHPTFVPVLRIATVTEPGRGRAIRVVLPSPRGAALQDVLERAGPLSEIAIAALFRDVVTGVAEAHARGLVVGNLGPDHLVLCPPGQDDLPPLRVVHAGLGPVVEAARGTPLGMEGSGFAQLHTQPEAVAPEVFAGTQLGAASDVYALCSAIARCALGRFVHAADGLGATKALAQAGVAPEDVGALHESLPHLGSAVCKGLAPTAWARAGVLAELAQSCNRLAEGLPWIELADRLLVAPWQRGSPLMALAAYASTGMWADRWQSMASVGTPLRFDAVRSATQKQAAAQLAELPAADQARLHAALERLQAERVRTQRQAGDTQARGASRLVALLILALLAIAIAALAMRQTVRIEETALPEFHRPRGPRPPPPPRPQPIVLDPEAPR